MKTIKEYINDLEQRLSNMEDAYVQLKENTDAIRQIVTELKNLQFGNWEVKDKQMIFYDLDNNELARFNLYNKYGKPSDTNVAKRVKQ